MKGKFFGSLPLPYFPLDTTLKNIFKKHDKFPYTRFIRFLILNRQLYSEDFTIFSLTFLN